MARDALASPDDLPSSSERRKRIDDIQRIVRSEIALARELYHLTRLDSMLGFDTFCQYFYLPLDLVEKVVNCEHLLLTFALPMSQGDHREPGI